MFGGKVGGTSLTFLGSLILGVPALAVFGGGPELALVQVLVLVLAMTRATDHP
jgi:hypothetical protein